MEIEITENGTQVFFLRHGEHQLDITADSWDASATVDLKSGPDEAGLKHTPVTNDGTAIQAAGDNLGDSVVTGGKWFSVVTADFGTTTGLVVSFRKCSAES